MPTKAKVKLPQSMDDLFAETPLKTLAVGDVINAKIFSVSRHEIWVDLGVYGAGLVARRETNPGTELKVGETVEASVVDPESDMGFPILSLKKISREQGWDRLNEVYKDKEVISIYPYDANRGGLLVEAEGIRGFLPVSQLSAEHYPRVANADKDEILNRLQSLVKQPLRVRVLDLDRDQTKLIFSEKEAAREDTKAKLAKIKVGQVVEGEVTGCVDFGIFVTVEGIEGLVHISEIAWERVVNPQELYKIGDKIKAKVIAIDNDKLSLSIKQLSEDPWLSEAQKLKVGQTITGTITRLTPFGAFVQVTPAVEALLHISELPTETELEKQFEAGKVYDFKVLEIDDQSRKITLTTIEPKPKSRPKTKSK